MNILDYFMIGLIEDDICPKCLGNLDEGYECNKCGYDATLLLNDLRDEYNASN